MTDPVLHYHGSNFLEIVDTAGTHFVRIDAIKYIRANYTQLVICTNTRAEALSFSFLDKRRLQDMAGNILTLLSTPPPHIKDGLDAVKDAMYMVRKNQQDLTESLLRITEKLDTVRQEFKEELDRSLKQQEEEDEDEEEELEVVPVVKTSPVGEAFLFLLLILLLGMGVQSAMIHRV